MSEKTLDQLKEDLARLEVQAEISQYQRAQMGPQQWAELLEANAIWGNGNTDAFARADPFYGQLNRPDVHFTRLWHRSQIDDRIQGKWRPVFETEEELAEIRGICRVLTVIDEVAIGILESLSNYTVGTGFTYKATPRKGQEADELAEQVQAVLDEFVERTYWPELEDEIYQQWRRDGELLLVARGIGDGLAEPLVIDADNITRPRDERGLNDFIGAASLDWNFGVATDWNHTEVVHGFFVAYTPDQADWEFFPATDSVYFKTNTPRNVKRGLSDFYPVWPELELSAKVLGNTGQGSALQAAIAWIRKHAEGVSGSQIEKIHSGIARADLTFKTSGGGSRTVPQVEYKPGTILDVDQGSDYLPGPLGSLRNPQFIQIAQALMRYAGSRWSMPEYLVSGDASNANYSSSLVAESPFVKASEKRQRQVGSRFVRFLWQVVRVALESKRITGVADLDELKAAIEITTSYPRVSVRNRTEETSVRAQLAQAGLLSKQTWSTMEDLDYDREQELIAQEQPAVQPQMPGLPGLFGQPQQQQPPEGETKEQPEAVKESMLRRRLDAAAWVLWGGYP